MYFDMLKCEQWKSGCSDCHDKRALFLRSESNYELKRQSFLKLKKLVFVPVSDWLGRHLKESFVGNYPIVTIHNGVDLNVFKPRENTMVNTFEILGVAAVWDTRKGLDDFFKLRFILPEDEYKITLVGLSEKQKKKLPQGIKGIQRTNSVQELAGLYSEADVFVNPTYSDNFPTTNIEALACGTPVITYNTGGSPEAIDDRTGRVVNQGDIDGLVKAIKDIKENPLDSEECRKRAETLFNKEERYKDYINLYEQLLKQ
jgi:glycosyltransferase involved in cell wall biosynthesis